MRKISIIMILGIVIICFSGCTNNEGPNDLDVLTPNDTTSAVLPEKEFQLN